MNERKRSDNSWVVVVALILALIGSMALQSRAASAGAPQPPADPPTQMVPQKELAYSAGQIIVAFKPATKSEERQRILEARGLRVLRQVERLGFSVVETPIGQEQALARELARQPGVRYAEPDYLVRAFGTPNDPSFSQQWNMTIIDAPAAWDVTTGSPSTIIAILDTGIDLTHPDLQSKIVAGYDFVNNDAAAQDDEGHGTHCAGIAAAASNNGVGVAGVNWQAALMPVKVLNSEGFGSYSNVAAGIAWAADHNATVISMSFGGPAESQTLLNAVNYAYSRGVIMVAAAGNEYDRGNPTNYPAALDHVIGVAATTSRDTHAYYSNAGFYVDLAAPGGEASSGSILSTLWTPSSHTYGRMSGTSMATPHVAGLAALLKAVNPALTPAQVEWVMQYTAVDLGERGRDDFFGWGRINALAAVNAASNPEPTPTPTPSPCIVESPHPYPNNYTFTWTVRNPDGAAPASRVHFSRIDTESDWDVIELLDAGGTLRQTITGVYPNGLWSEVIPGAVVQVRLRTDSSVVRWGFCLDAIETVSGTTPTPTFTPTPPPSNCLIETSHPYENLVNLSWTLTNPDVTAAYSRIHFSRLETEEGFDFVSIHAGDGSLIATYSGVFPSGFWSPPIPGRSVGVRLRTDFSVVAWGFCVDAIETVPPPAWTIHASLASPRSRLAVVSVGAKLYAIGGEAASAQSTSKKPSKARRDIEAPVHFAREGISALDISSLVEEYDPNLNRWTTRAAKPIPVSNISAGVLNGLIYVPGGYTSDESATSALEIYNPATDRWSAGASLPVRLFAQATTAGNGKLYVLGGTDGEFFQNSCYEYDPATNAWRAIAPMAQARGFAGAAFVGGKVYVVGGMDDQGNDLATAEVYDPATNRWSALPAMRVARGGPGVIGAGGKIFVAGGGWRSYLSSVEVYDPATGAWSDFDALNVGRRTLGLTYAGGRLYAVGGYTGDFTGVNESHVGPSGAPQISIAPTSFTYRLEEGRSAQSALQISNRGDADLTYVISDELVSLLPVIADAPWLSETPTAGVVPPGASQTVSITVNAAGLQPGQYLARLVIESNDVARPRLLAPVSLTVEARNPVELYFNPSHSDVALNAAFRVDVMLMTGPQPIDSVDVLITFDPRILQVVDAYGNPATQVIAGVDLPLVLQNSVNNAAGRINYGAGRRLGDRPPAGTFRLATIRFRAISQTIAASGTPLTFDPASQVYYAGAGVLGRARNGSVIVQAPWFTGRVTLQGRGRAPSTRWIGYPVTVTLLDQSGASVRSFDVTLDENGKFVILAPPAGTFGVRVKGSHTLSNLRQNVTLPSPQVIDLDVLREGDVNNDDRVAGGDFSLLVTAYGSRAGEPRWDPRADLDGDGRVGTADFSLLASNYGLRGPIVLAGAGTSAGAVSRRGGSVEVWIEPARRLVDPNEIFQATITLNTGDGSIDTVGTVLSFDPTILTVVDAAGNPTDQIIPGTALPTVVLNRVDNQAGLIEYDAGVSLGSAPKSGRIVIATIRFKALQHTSSGLEGTPIDFLAGTETYLAGEPQLSQRTGAAVIVAFKLARVNLPRVMQQ